MFTLVVHEVAWAKVQVNSLKSIKYRKSYSADIKMTSRDRKSECHKALFMVQPTLFDEGKQA